MQFDFLLTFVILSLLAEKLAKPTIEETLQSIFDFVYNYIQ